MVNINSDLCETSCCVGWPIAIDSISIEQEKYRNECDEDTGCTAVNCQLRENINDFVSKCSWGHCIAVHPEK